LVSQEDTAARLMSTAQGDLVAAFTRYDGAGEFRRAVWDRDGLGGGTAQVLADGRVFERAGVNVSLVHGAEVPPTITATMPAAAGRPFVATGVSIVLHPRNPYAPSFHANFRYFGVGPDLWWFGGGCDLTPSYGFDEDAAHFHRTLAAWCDRHDPAWYPEWKTACDEYFTIPHRGETRGVGGVFFDRLTGSFDRCHDLVADGIATVLPAYLPILDRRCDLPYGERERAWQLLRRGRYVEFNLVHDRGTRFGLQTGGNIEAILMSLPPAARWEFAHEPEPGSPEADLARFLRPHDWLGRDPVALRRTPV
jgi:coproporphyrinogen III oxidase